MPTHVPGVRHAAGAGEGGRRRHPLPERPVLPGPAAGAGVPPRRARRVRHRGARLRGGRGAARRGRRSPTRATCSPSTADDLLRSAPFFTTKAGDAVGATPPSCCDNLERGQDAAAVAGAGRAVDPARRPDRGAGAGHASSAPSTRSRRRPRRSWPRSRASARPSPRRSSSGSASTGTARSSRSGAPPGCGWPTSATPRSDRDRWTG